MTRTSGTRRAVLLTGAAALAAAALTACSAGQVAETANKVPSVYHAAGENADASVLVRGLAVPYNTPKGYPEGGTAPVEVQLFNQTSRPVTVTIRSGLSEQPGVVMVASVGLSGTAPGAAATTAPTPASSPAGIVSPQPTPAAASPARASAAPAATPTAGATPSATGGALRPATIVLEPLGSVYLKPGGPQSLVLSGLRKPLTPGTSVSLEFAFDNGAPPLTLNAPVAIPESPAVRGSKQAPEAEIGQHE